MRRIRISNPKLEKNYRTYLTADYSSGTSLTIESSVSFAANDFLVAGEPREERTELRQLSTVTNDTAVTINSAFRFSHSKGTPIYKTSWDFVSIERRISSAGVFAEITQSAIQWDNKLDETVYFDSAATASYEYRFRYYNSSSVTYSEYSPTLTGAAPDRNTVRYMVDRVRVNTGDIERKIVSDDEIIRAFNQAQDIIYAHNPRYWFLKVDTFEAGSGSIAATAGTGRYTLANLTNYGHLSSIKYRHNSGSTDVIYHLRRIDEVEFDRIDSDQNTTDDDWPQVYKLIPADSSSDNGYFKITPDILTSSIGTFYPVYYEKMADLDSVDDETQVPLPNLLIDFAIGYTERVKGNETKAGIYESPIVETVVQTGRRSIVRPAQGLLMLDQMNNQQKRAVGQPQVLKVFKGHKAIKRLFGNKYPGVSMDYIRENYF